MPAFDIEAAFNKFTSSVAQKLDAQEDKIKRVVAVRKTGARPAGGHYTGVDNFGGGATSIRRIQDPAGILNSKGFSFARMMLCIGSPSDYSMDHYCPNEKALMCDLTQRLVES